MHEQEPIQSHVTDDVMLTQAHSGFLELNLITTSEKSDRNSSKRSSSSSVSVSTTSSSTSSAISTTSGIESGEETTTSSKYSELDIAKILHTRKRIHRILQSPSDVAVDQEIGSGNPQDQNNGKKKTANTGKRYTNYNTLGTRRTKSMSAARRYSSGSFTPSAGDELSENASSNNLDRNTPELLRSHKNEMINSSSHYLTPHPKVERLSSKESASDEDSTEKRNSPSLENRRWSRTGLNSQNSEKASVTPQKGPWKAFRKFVNSSNSSSPKSQTHEEMKATIRLCQEGINCNNNNNNNQKNKMKGKVELKDNDRDGHEGKTTPQTNIANESALISSGRRRSPSTKKECSPLPPRVATPTPRYTNSLLRRFSRKSVSRSKSSRRKSLPVQSALDVRSGSLKHVDLNPGEGATQTPHFQYGDGSQPRCDIENMVMASVQSRVDEEEEKKKSEEKSRKSNSFRKRLMSFTKKRSSSRERKTILTENIQSNAEQSGQMNKTLSYSSPQLSVFGVNQGSNRTKTSNNFVF